MPDRLAIPSTKRSGYHRHGINCCHALAKSLHSPRLGFGSIRPVEYGLNSAARSRPKYIVRIDNRTIISKQCPALKCELHAKTSRLPNRVTLEPARSGLNPCAASLCGLSGSVGISGKGLALFPPKREISDASHILLVEVSGQRRV